MADIDIEAPADEGPALSNAIMALIADRAWQQVISSHEKFHASEGGTAEEVVTSIEIPALRKNSKVKISTFVTFNNSGTAKTLRYRYGGDGLDGTAIATSVFGTGSGGLDIRIIQNQGDTSLQKCYAGTNGIGSSSLGLVTSTIDTSEPSTVYLTVQRQSGTDSFTIDSYFVEILYGQE
jgi:hypothetical protein